MEIKTAANGMCAQQIIRMLRRAFSLIDPRLVDHGERVAFIVREMIRYAPEAVTGDERQLMVLSVLHDVGAYKTEEIDRMVQFETTDVYAHAVYGYLFLNSTTRIGDSAETILHHHTPWEQLSKLPTKWKGNAALIHVADRVDVLTHGEAHANLNSLSALSGRTFQPQAVELFFRANEALHIMERIADGSYMETVEETFATLEMDDEAALEYLRMIVYAIDFRSPLTVTHTANTVALSRELGRHMRLSPSEAAALETGAFLHDIGKIGIPVSILESPNRLSPEDMALMRTHVTLSEEILRGLVSDEVCDIAVRHHEKCNGTGYPRGLTAEELTLPQRILAVSDIVSALMSKRSYKEEMPKEQVIGILTRMRDAGELCAAVCSTQIERFDEIADAVALQTDPVLHQYEQMREAFPTLLDQMRRLG